LTDVRIKLAERVEAATGPDRLSDGEIWRVVHRLTIYDVLTPEGEISVSVPAITASIDAALLLVPEGQAIPILNEAIAECWSATHLHSENKHKLFLERLPSFVCAASLRALATDTGKEG
jgi:hypothetical protein